MQKQKLCKFIVSAFMSESYKMSALFRPQRQNRMKCQRRQIKIHLNRTIIAVNHPLYTFQPESMSRWSFLLETRVLPGPEKGSVRQEFTTVIMEKGEFVLV